MDRMTAEDLRELLDGHREVPYDNLDWEWEIEHGVPLPPGTRAVSRTALEVTGGASRIQGRRNARERFLAKKPPMMHSQPCVGYRSPHKSSPYLNMPRRILCVLLALFII